MKYQTYIYGRTLKIDFREICSPPGGLTKHMGSLVQELINTDVISNGEIKRLRYLFVRDSGRVLFGVGFNHGQYLNGNLQTDLGNRGLRSFVGIVIKEHEFDSLQSIPIDSDFYITLYKKYISRVWELEDRPTNRRVILSETSEQETKDNWCRLDGNISFNADESVCRFLNPTDENNVLRSIKRCSSNIVIGLNVERHVLTALRRFHVKFSNAICSDTKEEHDYQFVTKSDEISVPHHHLNYKEELLQYSQVDNETMRTVQHSDGGMPPKRPAILSTLKKDNSATISKQKENRVLGDQNLMKIDWGAENMVGSSREDNDMEPLKMKSDNMSIRESLQEHDSKNKFSEEIYNDEANNTGIPKKTYRLKLMILGTIATFIVLALIIGRCRKFNQTTSPNTVSGDTIKAVKSIHK